MKELTTNFRVSRINTVIGFLQQLFFNHSFKTFKLLLFNLD